MNEKKRQARRHHWHSESFTNFVDSPRSAIEGPVQGQIFNLTDKRATPSWNAQLELHAISGPTVSFARISKTNRRTSRAGIAASLGHACASRGKIGRCPPAFCMARLRLPLKAARPIFRNCLTPGIGARTVQSPAMVAEVVHGAP
jgi:hypothetical protein